MCTHSFALRFLPNKENSQSKAKQDKVLSRCENKTAAEQCQEKAKKVKYGEEGV